MTSLVSLPALPAGWPPPVERHPAAAYLARLRTPSSRRTQASALRQIASLASGGAYTVETLPWPALGYVYTQALAARIVARYAPATAERLLAALRGVLRQSWLLGLMDADEYNRAIQLDPAGGSRLPAGRALTLAELRALERACRLRGGAAGARDLAIVVLGAACGLRRAEIAGLDMDSYSGGAVRLVGKGGRERIVPVPAGERAALTEWIAIRGKDLARSSEQFPNCSDVPGPLVCPVSQLGVVELRRLGDQSIRLILARLADEAGVEPVTPHDLRRTYVTRLLSAGADVLTTSRLAGHQNPATTSRYDRRGEDTDREAAEMATFVRRP